MAGNQSEISLLNRFFCAMQEKNRRSSLFKEDVCPKTGRRHREIDMNLSAAGSR